MTIVSDHLIPRFPLGCNVVTIFPHDFGDGSSQCDVWFEDNVSAFLPPVGFFIWKDKKEGQQVFILTMKQMLLKYVIIQCIYRNLFQDQYLTATSTVLLCFRFPNIDLSPFKTPQVPCYYDYDS